MGSWFGWKRGGGDKGGKKQVIDGREIEELVENKEAFATFVHHKFNELDHDHDGRLSVQELQPAVADIGAALGLPAQGASAESDHIYSEATKTEMNTDCGIMGLAGLDYSWNVHFGPHSFRK